MEGVAVATQEDQGGGCPSPEIPNPVQHGALPHPERMKKTAGGAVIRRFLRKRS
jgi:hypothetical protein